MKGKQNKEREREKQQLEGPMYKKTKANGRSKKM
jgi:hypothetical protein